MLEPPTHGHTEPVLLEETLKLNGIQDRDDGLFERFATAQADGYCTRLEELRARGRVLPGTEEALGTLAAEPDVVQSVLTGNTRRAAQVKLSAFALECYLDLDVGAYGDDESYRPRLVDVAVARVVEQAGSPVPRTSTVLIGDAPKDIAAAREARVGVVAVATGISSVADLKRAGADLVLETLESVDIRVPLGCVLAYRAATVRQEQR